MQGNLKINTIRLNINNINVQCYAAGDTGPPVILLHGAGVDSARISWGEIIEPLSETNRVFARYIVILRDYERKKCLPRVLAQNPYSLGTLSGITQKCGIGMLKDIGLDRRIIRIQRKVRNADVFENLIRYVEEYQLVRISLTDKYKVIPYYRHIFNVIFIRCTNGIGSSLGIGRYFYESECLTALKGISKRIITKSGNLYG